MSRKKKQLHTEKSKDLGNAKQQHEASTVVPGTACKSLNSLNLPESFASLNIPAYRSCDPDVSYKP